jgi:hypothetical protein
LEQLIELAERQGPISILRENEYFYDLPRLKWHIREDYLLGIRDCKICPIGFHRYPPAAGLKPIRWLTSWINIL